jgi:hypothetical protein
MASASTAAANFRASPSSLKAKCLSLLVVAREGVRDLGPAAAASDQAVVDQVDDISALLVRGLATAMAQGNADWFSRYASFVDLVSERLEDAG